MINSKLLMAFYYAYIPATQPWRKCGSASSPIHSGHLICIEMWGCPWGPDCKFCWGRVWEDVGGRSRTH